MNNLTPNQFTNLLNTHPLNTGSEAEQHRKNLQLRIEHSPAPSGSLSENIQSVNAEQTTPVKVNKKKPKRSLRKRVRWGYLVPRFTLLVIFWAVLAFGLDPMLRYGFTSASGASLGTSVGIDKLQSDLFSPSMKIKRIQVADRDTAGTNAIEIDQIEINLNRNALLRKKFIIDSAKVTGITWNTESSLSPAKKQTEKKDSLWAIPFQLGANKLKNIARKSGGDLVEDLLVQAISPYNPADLETVQLADLKEDQWKSRFELYKNTGDTYKQKVEDLKKKIELAKKGNPLDNLQKFAQIARETDQLVAEGKRLKNDFTQLNNIARSDLAELDAAKTRDYEKLREKIASLPVNAEQLTQTILGPETRRQFEQVAGWIQFIQNCMNVATQDYEPTRTIGRTVPFDQADHLPTFLIREFQFNGVASNNRIPVPFSGLLKNITHDPKKFGKPMQYEIQLAHQGSALLSGLVDLTGEVPKCTMNCKIEMLEFPVQNLADHDKLQFAIATGKLQGLIKLTLIGDAIDAKLSWNQSDVNFLVTGDMQLQQKELSKIGFAPISPVALLKRSVQGIDGIHGEVNISGSLKSPKIELKSGIGEMIASRLQAEFRKEASLRKEEARELAEYKINERLQKLTSQIDHEYKAVLADLNFNESMVKRLTEKVAVRPASGILKRLFR